MNVDVTLSNKRRLNENLKRTAQIIICLILAANVAFAAMHHGETGYINFPFSFMLAVFEVLILALGGFWE